MASLQTLPPDQRAVLELVLRRGRSYDEIADLLGIDRAGVRERALAALDALGPKTGVPAERRALITDYLLGALPAGVADDVRDRLGTSASERAWARVIASELAPIAREPLPEIPVEAPVAAREPQPEAEPEPPEEPQAAGEPKPPAEPEAAGAPPSKPATSRRGGALLLAGGALIVAAVVAAILATSGGGSSTKTTAGSGTTSQASTSTTAAATGGSTNAQVLAQINLNPPSGGKAKGVAEVLRQQGRTGVAIVAQGLTPNTKNPPSAYAVWLYNSPSDAHILGFVNPPVGNNGRLQTAGGFPSNAAHFQRLLITLETQSNPKSPGPIVLQGTLTGVS